MPVNGRSESQCFIATPAREKNQRVVGLALVSKPVQIIPRIKGGAASAELIGSITANIPDTTPPGGTPGNPTPTVVPEPSTVLGGISAGGLILVFLLRRFRRDGSAAAVA
ncbi:MAG: hypothetical protein WCC08_09145 [Terrimicrobiaceae bacterium]